MAPDAKTGQSSVSDRLVHPAGPDGKERRGISRSKQWLAQICHLIFRLDMLIDRHAMSESDELGRESGPRRRRPRPTGSGTGSPTGFKNQYPTGRRHARTPDEHRKGGHRPRKLVR